MKIFIGEQPKNPYQCGKTFYSEFQLMKQDCFNEGQQSILNQCAEVENEVLAQYVSKVKELNIHDCREVINTISQSIQSEIKKQEGKGGKNKER